MTSGIGNQNRSKRPGVNGATHLVPDGTHGKMVPDGLRALFRTIASNWLPDGWSGKKRRSVDQFTDCIFDIYLKNTTRYGINPYKRGGLKSRIEKLNNGDVTPDFIDIRSYADYINVPPGIFLLISHLIGSETDDPINARDRAKGVMSVTTNNIMAIYSIINSPEKTIFVEVGADGNTIKIKHERIRELVELLFGVPGHLRKTTNQLETTRD